MEKTTFILHTKYADQLEMLSDAQAAQFVRAVFAYAKTGQAKVDDPVVSMMLSFVYQQMDSDYQKYQEACEKRKEAASKAGKASAEKRAMNKAAKGANQAGTTELANSATVQCEQQATTPDMLPCEYPAVHRDVMPAEDTADAEYQNAEYQDAEYHGVEYHTANAALQDAAADANEIISICYTVDEYPTTRTELARFEALTQELFTTYCPKQLSSYDRETVFNYVYTRIELDDDTAIAAYDEQKAELLRYTFAQAAKNDRVTWNYIDGIYSNYARRGIQSVNDAERYEWERRYPAGVA